MIGPIFDRRSAAGGYPSTLQGPTMVEDAKESGEAAVEPSELDELTHAEVLVLYRGCQDNIRFAKGIQWKTVSWTVVIFTLFVLACNFIYRDEVFVRTVIFLSFGVSMASIYALSIYQSWQGTEREKVRIIIEHLSNLATTIHRKKSRVEANIHRFTLYGFMVFVILAGNYLAVVVLLQLNPK